MRFRRFTILLAVGLLVAGSIVAADAPPWSDIQGTGEPTIVLIHGIGSDRTVWDLLVPRLAAAHRVMRIELPGHGASPPLAHVTVRDVARAVDRALEERKVERAVLVGHSYGAWVALEEAAARPKRAAAVVVLDIASYTPPDTARISSLTRFLADRYPALIQAIFEPMSIDPIESDSAVAHALRVPREVMVGYLHDSWHGDMRARIKRLKTPVELVATETSWPPSLPWEAAKGAFSYQTAGPFQAHRVFASGHFLMRDRPDTLAVILDDIARRASR